LPSGWYCNNLCSIHIYIYVYTYTYTCLHIYTDGSLAHAMCHSVDTIDIHVYILRIFIYIDNNGVPVCICTYVCPYSCIHIHTYTRAFFCHSDAVCHRSDPTAHIYEYIGIYIHVYIYMYIYIRDHIYTCRSPVRCHVLCICACIHT